MTKRTNIYNDFVVLVQPGDIMSKSNRIEIWQADSETAAKRDEIVRRCEAIEGCKVLHVGYTPEEYSNHRYTVITSSVGKATETPAVEFYGYKSYPDGPRVELLVEFELTAEIKIKVGN